MTIYIDVIIVENLIMNYIILYATGTISKVKISYLRIFCSSLIGAIYAITEYTFKLNIYSNIIIKTILSVIIIYVAFNPQNIKKMCKQLIIFYVTTFTFGGIATYLIYVLKPQNIIIKNGMYVGTYVLKVIFIGAIIGTIILFIAFKQVKKKITKTKTSGISKRKFIKKEILNNTESILGGDFQNIPEDIKREYIPKLKIIPFASLGKQNGMLVGIKPEKIEIINEQTEENKNAIIGIYNKSLTKKGEYNALIGIELY